jgi:hypothetical protein
MPYYINPPPQNPLARIMAAIIAVFVLVGSVMIGMAALLVVAGVGLIAGIAIWLRIAWIKRRLQKNGVDLSAGVENPRQSGNVIDAEYTVISESKDTRDK